LSRVFTTIGKCDSRGIALGGFVPLESQFEFDTILSCSLHAPFHTGLSYARSLWIWALGPWPLALGPWPLALGSRVPGPPGPHALDDRTTSSSFQIQCSNLHLRSGRSNTGSTCIII